MKNIFLFCCLMMTAQVWGQTANFDFKVLSGSTEVPNACPNTSYTVTATVVALVGQNASVSASCFNLQLNGSTAVANSYSGALSTNSANQQVLTFTDVKFPDDGQNTNLSIVKLSGTGCNTGVGVLTNAQVKVRTIATKQPSVGGPTRAIVGQRVALNYAATLLYASGEPVTSFTWTVPTGWTITSGQNTSQMTVLTDAQGGEGCITAKGNNTLCAGALASAASPCLFVERFVPAPCPIVFNRTDQFLICGDVSPFTLTATAASPPIAGVTYTWTLPTGWINSGQTGSAINVTPDGLNGGEISVKATAFGKTSGACTLNIPLRIVHPSTAIVGGTNFLCDGGSAWAINIVAAAQTAVTWSVSPANATIPSSGTGDSAMLTPSPGYQGTATLTFTMTNTCGSETRATTFGVGNPCSLNITDFHTFQQIDFKILTNPVVGEKVLSYEIIGVKDNFFGLIAQITLFNAIGQVQQNKKETLSSNILGGSFSTIDWAKGMYFLQLKIGNWQKTTKFIVE
ncbi:MAG: hypothetical protein RL757_2065 [Bacteroidota bacterium]|jgi:hypothetical protein